MTIESTHFAVLYSMIDGSAVLRSTIWYDS